MLLCLATWFIHPFIHISHESSTTYCPSLSSWLFYDFSGCTVATYLMDLQLLMVLISADGFPTKFFTIATYLMNLQLLILIVNLTGFFHIC